MPRLHAAGSGRALHARRCVDRVPYQRVLEPLPILYVNIYIYIYMQDRVHKILAVPDPAPSAGRVMWHVCMCVQFLIFD